MCDESSHPIVDVLRFRQRRTSAKDVARVVAIVVFSAAATALAREHAGVGDSCGEKVACPPNTACVDGRCLCETGFRVLHRECIIDEPASPTINTTPPTHFLSKTSPFRVSDWVGATSCRSDAEAHSERAAVGGDALFFVAYNSTNTNWARPYSTWGTTANPLPAASGSGGYGDPSVTTSDFTGLNYVGLIGFMTGHDSLVIAATSSDLIDTNSWTYPLRGIDNISDYQDGCAIEYDIGGTDLWAANYNGGGHRLRIMKSCKTGAPGCCVDATCTNTCTSTATEQCPINYNAIINSSVHDFPNIAVNPCSHNGIVVYKLASNEIHFQTRTPDGVLVKDQIAETGQAHDDNTGCQFGQVRTCNVGAVWCADTQPISGMKACMSMTATPQIATTSVSGKCYAVLAYS
jgi:hypothetical protein